MSVVAAQPVITPLDRLGLTLCLAVIAHAVFLLGVSFAPEERPQPNYDTMEIVLVQQKSREAPDDAQLLAQASLEGGGDAPDAVTPGTPLPPPFPGTEAQVAPPPPELVQPQTPVAPAPETSPTESRPETALAAEAPDAELSAPELPAIKPEPDAAVAAPDPRPSAAALLNNSFKIAALSAEIKRKLEAQSQRPRRKFVSASTREYKYASYMEAWRAKVERVGNLNYPDEARKRSLSGSLILDVALNPDGSVNQITIRRSSGYAILDDAAIRIVNLAQPFAPFPDGIRSETDIMHITRTWQFLNNRGFR